MSEQKEHVFHVEGMHCDSCVFFIEEALSEKEGVARVKVDLKTCTARVVGDFAGTPEEIAQKLTPYIAENGYVLREEEGKKGMMGSRGWKDFSIAIPAALGFIGLFLFLQEIDLVNIVGSGAMTYGTALLLGGIASLSTCLAVVGGLVLSFSANAAKEQRTWRSPALFHVGRLLGFFILGGVIGVVGNFFQLGMGGTAVLGILVALVMFVLGVNLLEIFPGISRFLPKMPRFLSRHATRAGASSHLLAPFLGGVATFFLPCGFTQSIQVYTLTTGSFLSGGLTMFFFALGTLPVLAALSFGAFEIAHKPWKGVFFKTAGIVVIILAAFNFWNALNLLGF